MTGTTAPPVVDRLLAAPGRGFEPNVRQLMESRFQHDFARIRIHTDSAAAESARAINALAYTVGSHIVFAGDRYQPETPAGRRLLAHELTHTLQQEGGGVPAAAGALEIDAPDSPLESEAEERATAVGRNPVQAGSRLRLQRSALTEPIFCQALTR